jgi:hypothetical protein
VHQKRWCVPLKVRKRWRLELNAVPPTQEHIVRNAHVARVQNVASGPASLSPRDVGSRQPYVRRSTSIRSTRPARRAGTQFVSKITAPSASGVISRAA